MRKKAHKRLKWILKSSLFVGEVEAIFRQFSLTFLCRLEPQTTKSIDQSCQCEAIISLFALNQFAQGYFQTQSARSFIKLRKYSKQKQKLGNNWFAFLELPRRFSSGKLTRLFWSGYACNIFHRITHSTSGPTKQSIKLQNKYQSSLYNESAESMEIELMRSRLRRRNIPADAMSSEVK